MLVLVFMTDEDTVTEHVYPELALRRGKKSFVQLIQHINVLLNIYIYIIYFIYIYMYIYVDVLNGSCF